MTDAGSAPLVTSLRRLLHPPARPDPGARCELCGADLPEAHAHVVDVRTRRLLCACRLCGAPEEPAAAPQGRRFRPVPARYLHLPAMTISTAQWDALAIPVDLAFFFFNSDLGRTVALYPGAAGVAESLLPLDAWSSVMEANPWVDEMAPDVEALLVRRTGGEYSCFLVPIDACYELAGRIRAHWSGLDGGGAVRAEIERFFAAVRARGRR